MEREPLEKRIAIFGVDSCCKDNLEYIVKKFQDAGETNIFRNSDKMVDIFEKCHWAQCFLANTLRLVGDRIYGTKLDDGRFYQEQFIGDYSTGYWNYEADTRCCFINKINDYIIVADGTGRLITYSNDERRDLWKGPVLFPIIQEWYNQDIDYISVDDIIL